MITITHSPVTYGNPTHYVGHNYMFYLKEELHKLVHLKVAYTIALNLFHNFFTRDPHNLFKQWKVLKSAQIKGWKLTQLNTRLNWWVTLWCHWKAAVHSREPPQIWEPQQESLPFSLLLYLLWLLLQLVFLLLTPSYSLLITEVGEGIQTGSPRIQKRSRRRNISCKLGLLVGYVILLLFPGLYWKFKLTS